MAGADSGRILFSIRFLELEILEQISKAGSDVLRFRNLHFFYRFFLYFFQSLHAEADLAVFYANDLNVYFLAFRQHVFWRFHALLALSLIHI